MSRRSSGSPSLLLLLVLIVLVFLAVQRSYRSRRMPRLFPPPSTSVEPRVHSDEARRREKETGRHPETRESMVAACETLGVKCNSRYFGQWQAPGENACMTRIRNGFPVPDPRCTPGGVNASVTAEVLRDRAWRTGCIRNCQASEAEKHATYKWYGLQKPRSNSGESQVCELDHLVPLEL